MTLTRGVFDQYHFARCNDAALTIARGELHAVVEVHDVLTARRRMPIEIVLSLRLAENDSVGRQAFGKLAASPLLGPFDFNIAKVRYAVRVGVQVVNTHAGSYSGWMI